MKYANCRCASASISSMNIAVRDIASTGLSKRFGGTVVALAILLIYLSLAAHIIMNGGYLAQDFKLHIGFTRDILSGTSPWDLKGGTNPPLLFILGAGIISIFGEYYGLPIVAGLLAAINAISIYLLWRICRSLFSDVWRLWFIAFIATLPAFVITSVVYAPDALSILPFFGYCALNLRLLRHAPQNPYPIVVSSCLIQIVGGLSKFTFIALAPASLFLVIYLAWRRSFGWRQIAATVLLVFIIPSTINFAVFKHYSGEAAHAIKFPHLQDRFALRSFLPYSRDIELLDAPAYSDPILENGQHIRVDRFGNRDDSIPWRFGYRILVDNLYSYPALLHLGIYTDINNVSFRPYASTDARSSKSQFFQRASVSLGLFFPLAVLLSNTGYLASAISSLVKLRRNVEIKSFGALDFLVSTWIPAACWYILIVGALPFMDTEVYYFGYWLPRLVMAPLVIFGAIGFWGLAKVANVRPLGIALQTILALQIFFQINATLN